MRKPATALAIALAAVSGLASCRLGADRDLPPYRCLETLSLDGLIHTVGPPPSQVGSWHASGGEVAVEQRVFDLHQEAALTLAEPAPYMASLCRQLETELARRCEVRTFWPGVEHCAAELGSPRKAIAGQDGVYHHRGFSGRVHLFASRKPDGPVSLVLTGTERAS